MSDPFTGFDLNAQYPGYLGQLFQIEGGGNPNAPPTGSNRGMGQFSPDLEKKYGITDQNRTDPAAQTRAVQMEAAEHYPILQKALGRAPTAGELYLTHQQGVAGGPALMTASQDQPAWMAIRPYYKSDAIAKQAISGNIPSNHALYRSDVNGITAGDFRNLWVSRFDGGTGAASAAASRGLGTAVAPVPAATSPPAVAPSSLGNLIASASSGAPGVLPAASPSLTQNQTSTLTQAAHLFEEPQLHPAPMMQLPVNPARLRNVIAGKTGANPNAIPLPPSVKERIAALMGKT